MTAITLNLLAEEQQAQEARARDPVKVSVAIGVCVLALVVALGGMFAAWASQKQTEMQGLRERWQKLDAADAGAGEFQQIQSLANEILALNRSRVLTAPQLALVKDVVPATVQLSRIDFMMVTEEVRQTTGEETAGAKRQRPKSVERLVLRLEGKAVSNRPELEVDRFLQTLRGDTQFAAVVEDIELRSISRTASETDAASGALPAAGFVVECQYKARSEK
jgi:hypothetical protein